MPFVEFTQPNGEEVIVNTDRIMFVRRSQSKTINVTELVHGVQLVPVPDQIGRVQMQQVFSVIEVRGSFTEVGDKFYTAWNRLVN